MTQQTEKEAGRVVEGGEADRASRQRAKPRRQPHSRTRRLDRSSTADNEGGQRETARRVAPQDLCDEKGRSGQ